MQIINLAFGLYRKRYLDRAVISFAVCLTVLPERLENSTGRSAVTFSMRRAKRLCLVKDESMTPKDTQHWFEKILRLEEISSPGRKKHERCPCLHCIRHVFVFNSFAAAEKAGRKIDDSVPFSIYLGHRTLI